MNPPPDYSAAWRELRKRRLILVTLWLGYVPGVLAIYFGLCLPLSSLIGVKADYFVLPVALSWMLAFLIAGLRVAWFRCPRCQQWFFATWWYHNPLARKCVHRGLRKGANAVAQQGGTE